MRKPHLRLRGTIGRSHGAEPEDTSNVKAALRDLGYYRVPSFGITPYPDDQLFEGIEDFQDDFDLLKDGLMKPDGETARKLNEVMDRKGRPAQDRRPSPISTLKSPGPGPTSDPGSQSSTPPPSKDDRPQTAAVPAIPVIVYEVAVFLGMSLSAAYALWLSLTADEKQQLRDQIQAYNDEGDDHDSNEARCESIHEIDGATCRQISKRLGKQAGQRCWASASERYAACLRGRPVNELPPLDVWNN